MYKSPVLFDLEKISISSFTNSAAAVDKITELLIGYSLPLADTRLKPCKKRRNENLHPWVKVDQAIRPLPPRSLNIVVGLTLKLYSLCIIVSLVENIWTLWFAFRIFCVASLERFVLVGISQNVKFCRKQVRNSSR